MENPIITRDMCPPIPFRGCDWEAVRYNWDLGDSIGYGATEQEAIDDLIRQEQDLD